MQHHTTNDGFKCTKVDAAELLRQAVRKMTRPKDKRPKDKVKKREQPGTLWRKVQALNKLVKAAEKAGEEHVEYRKWNAFFTLATFKSITQSPGNVAVAASHTHTVFKSD